MSDVSASGAPGPSCHAPQGSLGGLARRILYFGLLAAVGFLVYEALRASRASQSLKASQVNASNGFGLVVELAPRRLAASFIDRNGDMLADPPGDPAKL